VLRACLELTDDFHALHSRGLCYKDISLGNLFLEPCSGRILICDNDNVDVDGRDPGGVLGTPGFIAPEVLMGTARPSANSDLHSLAVLIFRLLTRHDPFRGAMELEIRCLDEPARRRLYGEDPVFIFDPNDQRNRPDPELHSAALLTWPIYPAALQALFVQTFGPGLHEPHPPGAHRPMAGGWPAPSTGARSAMPAARRTSAATSSLRRPAGAAARPCHRRCLQLPCAEVVAAPGTTLHRHHFDRLQPPQFNQPLAEIVAHPSDATILGLCNRGPSPWQVTLLQGQQLQVNPGRSCNLAATAAIVSDDGRSGSIPDAQSDNHGAPLMPSFPNVRLANRPLHFIYICDCSGSMAAQGKMQALNQAIRQSLPGMARVARDNPEARVLVRAVRFADRAHWHIADPTPVDQLQWQDLQAGWRDSDGRGAGAGGRPAGLTADGGAGAAAGAGADFRWATHRRLRGGAGPAAAPALGPESRAPGDRRRP
jgi:serine/threonine protein kinase